ncbi:uncharacterized protein LOC133905891 isoform X2 [Phragmites australis]|uniref:uncharacterized protein LOC133905891 isoform X2 n=1 Tax=Phragmites australis TaxID=29695 RepID=UPI002D78E805|nr:uncharacterized protein LOC133905891 isoform X2 [Phragmites australis]
MNSQVGSNNRKNSNVVYQDLTKVLGLSRFDSENLSDVSTAVLPLKCAMDPTNLVHLRTVPSENGLRPVENSSDNLQGMAFTCESPLAGKVKFMCSFGGKILPRPSDGKLRYVGGETRLISITRNFSWKEFVQKTLTIYNQPHIIKYQLPDEDLDALISLSCDEDFQNMMEEYYTLEKANGSLRLRIFLVSLAECEDSSLDSRSLESEPEYHFVVAVNNLARLNRSISGNNLMSQSSHQLDSSPLPCRDSPVCQTDTESGAKALTGTTLNESPSQFFLAPCTQVVAESSATSSPSLSQHRTIKQSRMQPPADKSAMDCEPENRSEVLDGANLKAMLLNHQDKKQNDANTSIGVGSPMHHLHSQRQVKDVAVPGNESDLSPHTNYDMSAPVETPFYSEKVSMHPANARWAPGLHEYTGQVLGMPHAFSDPLLKDCTEVPASSLSLTADPYVASSISQKKCQTNDLERTISGTRPAFEHVKPPGIARTDEPNYLVSNHIDQQYDQVIIDTASLEPPVCYQHESLSSIVTQKGHNGGPVVQQQDKLYHQGNSTDPSTAPQSNFADTRFNLYHAHGARMSSDELDALEKSLVPTPILATDHSRSYLNGSSTGSQTENSNCGYHLEKLNSGCVVTDYGTAGYVHGNDKVAPEPHILLPVDPFEAFTLQISTGNRESCVCQNENLAQSSVQNSGLAISPHIRPSGPDLNINLYGNGTFCLSSSQNPVLDGVSMREDPLLDQHIISCSDVGVLGFECTTINNESVKLTQRTHNNVQLDVPIIVEDVTDNVPSDIPSSRQVVPQVEVVAEEQQDANISSEKDEDSRSNGPELANEDHDDRTADGSISDAAVAELEASMYGLQIIRNGDLEELRELGSGTFGTVYYGKWRGTDVAIKRIKKSCFAGRSSEQEKLTKDFWREAQILSKLHHPNVVAFYGVVPDGTGGTLATVTEFMVNGSLRNVLLRKDRSLQNA